jgi:hypothetical protein
MRFPSLARLSRTGIPPGADAFGALDGADNEEVGILLLEAISN